MSQQITNTFFTLISAGALPIYTRVKLGAGRTAVAASASEACIGVTQSMAGAAGEAVTVRSIKDGGTFFMRASKAIAADAAVYGAADGEITDTSAEGIRIVGNALEAATADGDIIEVIPTSTEAVVPAA